MYSGGKYYASILENHSSYPHPSSTPFEEKNKVHLQGKIWHHKLDSFPEDTHCNAKKRRNSKRKIMLIMGMFIVNYDMVVNKNASQALKHALKQIK